jgi:hypothetical protein
MFHNTAKAGYYGRVWQIINSWMLSNSLDGAPMRYYLIPGLLGILALSSVSCCQLSPMSRDTPTRPNIKSSWKERRDWTVTSLGPLILNKGESSDNGSLGVKAIDFIPRSCSSFLSHSPAQPKVVLQFYRPSDNHLFCEVTLSGPANAPIDGEEMCGAKTGVSVVRVNGINARDGWVSFDLRMK